MPFDATPPEVVVDSTVTRVLSRAVELIERGGWCRRSMALDAYGNAVHPAFASAVRFCAVGAIRRAGIDLTLPIDSLAALLLWRAIGRDYRDLDIPNWNDCQTSSHQVIAAFHAAIALSRQQCTT